MSTRGCGHHLSGGFRRGEKWGQWGVFLRSCVRRFVCAKGRFSERPQISVSRRAETNHEVASSSIAFVSSLLRVVLCFSPNTNRFSCSALNTRQVFSSVSTTVFSAFACDYVEDLDVSLLRADYSISCDHPDHLFYEVNEWRKEAPPEDAHTRASYMYGPSVQDSLVKYFLGAQTLPLSSWCGRLFWNPTTRSLMRLLLDEFTFLPLPTLSSAREFYWKMLSADPPPSPSPSPPTPHVFPTRSASRPTRR